MTDTIDLDNIAVVLHKPRFPENIGAAARAMRNMGVGKLILVDPENFDLVRVLRMATHGAAGLVKSIQSFDSLEEALAPFGYVVGTSARLGGQRRAVRTPARMARDLIPISRHNRIAVVFGPEDRGLTNAELRLCHALVTIPTAAFSSLNLAQSVMVILYELFGATRENGAEFTPRLAERHELDGMFEGLRDILVRISYINPENPDYWMNRIRQFCTRLRLRAKEVSIIRGIIRQIDWYGEKRYRDGLRAAGKTDSNDPPGNGN
jgi:tRNA/rRNA methyltransferase